MIRGFFLPSFGPLAPHVNADIVLGTNASGMHVRVPVDFLVDTGSHRTALGPSTVEFVSARLPEVDLDIDDLDLGAPWLTAGGPRRPRLLSVSLQFANAQDSARPYHFDLEIGLFRFQTSANDDLPNILGRDIINTLRITYDCPRLLRFEPQP